ncbi:hypothetical protein AVEN_77627-1 [Araneus ventricosus]|uniref:Uncharacterized protein n=1 Tax=Araneus ventricosus TaxID=182803 RepID=A0A4Y2IIK3_ARAVE|nr:hypothetical protein AVEN_77627-1 [Araneus ventricosus]
MKVELRKGVPVSSKAVSWNSKGNDISESRFSYNNKVNWFKTCEDKQEITRNCSVGPENYENKHSLCREENFFPLEFNSPGYTGLYKNPFCDIFIQNAGDGTTNTPAFLVNLCI